MSRVKRIGNYEVEVSESEKMVFISDLEGNLLVEFYEGESFELIEWIQKNSKK